MGDLLNLVSHCVGQLMFLPTRASNKLTRSGRRAFPRDAAWGWGRKDGDMMTVGSPQGLGLEGRRERDGVTMGSAMLRKDNSAWGRTTKQLSDAPEGRGNLDCLLLIVLGGDAGW